jgi:hypothetical protein
MNANKTYLRLSASIGGSCILGISLALLAVQRLAVLVVG